MDDKEPRLLTKRFIVEVTVLVANLPDEQQQREDSLLENLEADAVDWLFSFDGVYEVAE